MLVGFTRYSMDDSFSVIGRNKLFMLAMAAGSIVGAFIGAHLLGLVANSTLLPILAALLLISAVKIWRHDQSAYVTASAGAPGMSGMPIIDG